MSETMFLMCKNCEPQRPDDQSPTEWKRLEVFVKEDEGDMWMFVACMRCEMLVGRFQILFPPKILCGVCGECGECHGDETIH